MSQLKLDFTQRHLSARHGGETECRTYCRLFKYRPQRLAEQLLCSGGGDWEPCVDYIRCRLNRPRKPAPVAELRKEDKGNGKGNDSAR